jgi:hypothetical protein
MTSGLTANKRLGSPTRIERQHDFLIVSSFGLWALLLGLSPILTVSVLMQCWGEPMVWPAGMLVNQW